MNRKIGKNAPNWKGGRRIIPTGYVMIKLPNHPLARRDGYILEHRLIMASLIGIKNVIGKIVHHIDGDKSNNNPDNLQIMNEYEHKSSHRNENCNLRKFGEFNPIIKCLCGCGDTLSKYDRWNKPRKYINGHYWKHKRILNGLGNSA